MSKRWTALAAAIAATLIAPAVQAQDSGSWIVRGRALYLDPANKDDIASADVSVNAKLFPEVDISYFFTPNLAAELVLTDPQKHDVRVDGGQIGTLKHLPPTLSLQYHFTGMGWRPYVGLGLNDTHFSSVNLPAPLAIDKSCTGLALGAGFDVPMGGGWLFNVDVKKVQIRTDISASGTKLGELEVDPLLFSVGVGKRF